MALETLLNISTRLPVLALRCTIVMKQDGMFDENAGALFHGAFGWSLREAAPRLWPSAYGPLPQGAIRPFALYPPSACHWKKGDELNFELTLFSDLACDLTGIRTALQCIGERGIGSKRITFQLKQLVQLCPEGEQLVWSSYRQDLTLLTQTSGLDQALISASVLWSELPTHRLLAQLNCRSRLHIKDQGQVLSNPPSATLLARTIARRLLTLTETVCEHEKSSIYDSFNALTSVQLAWDHSHELAFNRFSSRTRQHHHINGLTGSWGYQGPGILHLLPWLAIGKWLHIGSKTTFGFGSIDWQVAAAE
jgi:Uncharacterized conserved protein (DUF2276).